MKTHRFFYVMSAAALVLASLISLTGCASKPASEQTAAAQSQLSPEHTLPPLPAQNASGEPQQEFPPQDETEGPSQGGFHTRRNVCERPGSLQH